MRIISVCQPQTDELSSVSWTIQPPPLLVLQLIFKGTLEPLGPGPPRDEEVTLSEYSCSA